MTGRRVLRGLAAALLVLWCLAFLRMETTEKSIVRAICLWQEEAGWTAGLLYQFPEAAADASDAAAELQLAAGQGSTLELALQTAERSLPQTASYRLCEYLLLDSATSQQMLQLAWQTLLDASASRLTARVLLVEGMDTLTFDPPEHDAENTPDRAEALLQAAEEAAPFAPTLLETAHGAVLPVLRVEDDAVTAKQEGCLITAQGNATLSAEETAMVHLLREKPGKEDTLPATGRTKLRRSIVSVAAEGEGFAVTVTLQPDAGSMLSPEACRELEALCTHTLARCWAQGYDLLGLGAVQTLQRGPDSEPLTTKNACPEVRASVVVLGF